MNQYQFEQVSRRMAQRYGKIRRGDEDDHMPMLFTMESNLLKVHRRYPSSNARRLLEAIPLALHTVEGYLTGKQADVSAFESEDNRRLRDALLMACDPFTNPELREALPEEMRLTLSNQTALEGFFCEAVKCMMRLQDSAVFWEKKLGGNGYFIFSEETIGSQIKQDDKMDFLIDLGTEIVEEDTE